MTQAIVTPETVSEVIGKVYDQFGFSEGPMPARIAAILNDPSKAVIEDEGDASEAAEEIRQSLWSRYSGGGASASSTCALFYKLGRQNELGWVRGEARGFIPEA